jgi:hypothetical protein
MGNYHSERRTSRLKNSMNRSLRLEQLEARLTLSSNFLGLNDAALAAYTQKLDADGSINRSDMIAILHRVQNSSKVVSANALNDLRTIVKDAPILRMPNYVATLAGDIVNGNTANAHYLGKALGNLVVGSSTDKLGKLTNKWFYGTDLPSTRIVDEDKTVHVYAYANTSGTLYGTAVASHLDEKQGHLGDCYLIASLGSVADKSPAAIQNMFISNGDGTWTVRFFSHSKADYVTVNRQLPISGSVLVFQGAGAKYWNTSNTLWLSLLEKAYTQWNETGNTERDTTLNAYAAIEGGWPNNVYQQALGYNAVISARPDEACLWNKSLLISTVLGREAVTIVTQEGISKKTTTLYGNHVYNVLSYSFTTETFTLYNPWGKDQPKQLTWDELANSCRAFFATPVFAMPFSSGIASNESWSTDTYTLHRTKNADDIFADIDGWIDSIHPRRALPL